MVGKTRIMFWVITLIILFGLLGVVGVMIINESKEKVVYRNLTPVGYDLMYYDSELNNNLIKVKKNNKYGLINNKGEILEKTLYEEKDFALGYDDYYRINTLDGKILIKRKGKIISDITNNENSYVLLKDENDKDSKYIIYEINNNQFSSYLIRENVYISNILIKNNEYKSIILDSNEGILKEIPGYVTQLLSNNKKIDKYLLQLINDEVNLIDSYDYNTLLEGYSRIGDIDNISGYSYGGEIHNDNYITLCKDKKCGIYNNNKLIIPNEYDDINPVQESQSLYFSVKLNNKYGIIDQNNKIIVPIEYDNAYAFNNNFILVDGNKLKIIDTKLNKIYEHEVDLENQKITPVLKNGKYIFITINDIKNVTESERYIIIDDNNKVKEYKNNIITINNYDEKMSDELYATYEVKNNEVHISLYDGLLLVKTFSIIQVNEIDSLHLKTVSNNELLLQMITKNGTYYYILNVKTGNIINNDVLKQLKVRDNYSKDFIVDIDEGNLVYYRKNLKSELLEENVINIVDVKDNNYIVKKIDNIFYLYNINRK